MRLIPKSAIITAAGVVLLGTGLALSSSGVVSGSSPSAIHPPVNHQCKASDYCLRWTNDGTGGGMKATTRLGAGIYGEGYNSDSIGVEGEANGAGEAVVAQVNDKSGDIFYGSDTTNSAQCTIDGDANLTCTGSISGGEALTRRLKNANGQHVLAYASESASQTIDDVGTARMIGGVANVRFARDFASTINRNNWYYVFLTPLGDTRGLYVSMKTSSGFQVRETEHGRSDLLFDYRIVARPLDAKNGRLPVASAITRPPALPAQ